MAAPFPGDLYGQSKKTRQAPSSSSFFNTKWKINSSAKQNFSCFICGQKFPSIDAMKRHHLYSDCRTQVSLPTPNYDPAPFKIQRPFEHYEFGCSEVPFKFLHQLGKGGAAVVDKVESTEPKYRGQCYARKTLIFTEDKAEEIQREVSIHRYLQHDNVIPILFTYRAAIKERFSTRHHYAMLMPVADGHLADFLEHWGNTPFCFEKVSSMNTLICWPKQLADGLNYLHNHPSGSLVRHNDIKPSNLLLQGSTILYADFGLSRIFDLGEATTTYTPAVPFTKLYSAPEVLDGPRSRSSDIFSLGCVFSEILTVFLGKTVAEAAKFRGPEWNCGYAQQPSKTLHWLLRLLCLYYKSQMPESFNVKMCMAACLRMLEPQPDLRVTADQLCQVLGWESGFQNTPVSGNAFLYQLRPPAVDPEKLRISINALDRVMNPGFKVSWDDLHRPDNFLHDGWGSIFPVCLDFMQIPLPDFPDEQSYGTKTQRNPSLP